MDTEKSAGPAIYREWLRSLPRLTGKSLTAIAREIGKPPSTLTRPLKPSDPGTSLPHQSTVDKIVARFGVAPPDFIPANGTRRAPSGLSEDAAPYAASSNDALRSAVEALVKGRNAADPWIIKTRSLELAGYLPGDIVIVDLGQRPRPGDAVCAQTDIDLDAGTATTVMRIYQRAGSADFLLSASLDPRLSAPIPVDDRVAIKGVIVGMVRPIRQAA